MRSDPRNKRRRLSLGLLAGSVLAVGLAVVLYRPDRPLAAIVPGSSSGPAFVVQILRPRAGLPLGGVLPPGLFGVDAALGVDSTSAGAYARRVGSRRLELGADGWEMVVELDGAGQVTPDSYVVFEMVFEERPRRVRCRPADPAVGTFDAVTLAGSEERSGRFDIELARCEDAVTGAPLGWPPKPLVLHGSFDRLPADG